MSAQENELNEPNHTSIAADLFMLCMFVALIVALSADVAPVVYDPRFIDREYGSPTTRTVWAMRGACGRRAVNS